jgi:hypothetical protein
VGEPIAFTGDIRIPDTHEPSLCEHCGICRWCGKPIEEHTAPAKFVVEAYGGGGGGGGTVGDAKPQLVEVSWAELHAKGLYSPEPARLPASDPSYRDALRLALEENAALNAQVTALQARGTELVEEARALRALESAVRRDLATYLKDFPDGTRFALTEIALQYLPPAKQER